MTCERGKNIGITEPLFAILKKQGIKFEIIELKRQLTNSRFLFAVPEIYPLEVDYVAMRSFI